MQLRFPSAEAFDPLPQGVGHYVAALQNKKGELDALSYASPETWSRLTPLMQIVGPKKRQGPLKAQTVTEWVKRMASAVGDHACFLDIRRLKPMQAARTTAGEHPVLAWLYKAARKRRLQFVPVFQIGDHNAAYLNLVRDAMAEDGRGVALRYPVLETMPPPGSTPARLLSDTLSALGADITAADLLLDLGFLSADTQVHPEDIAAFINDAAGIGAWRSLVVLGTSMPATLGSIPEGDIGSMPRREWDLWSALSDVGVERLPSYGDYAVQHPKPPQDEGGPGMRANIRYTTQNATLIARGKGSVLQEGNQQYRELCRQLVSQPDFAGAGFSWGDDIIQRCADGRIAPGAQDLWRGVGTSHHVRLVTEQLNR